MPSACPSATINLAALLKPRYYKTRKPHDIFEEIMS